METANYFFGQHITTIRAEGTRVAGNNNATNATNSIYTVPLNSELLLTDWWHTTAFGANGIGSIVVFDTTPVLIFYLNRQIGILNTSLNMAKIVMPSLLLPASYSVRLISNALNVDTYGGIIGYTYPTA